MIRSNYPALMKSLPWTFTDLQNKGQHKSITSLAGLLPKRGAFPSTSLGDTKLGTDRDALRATNTEHQMLSGLAKGNEDMCTAIWHLTAVRETCSHLMQDSSSSLCRASCGPVLHLLCQIFVPTAIFRKKCSGEMLILCL